MNGGGEKNIDPGFKVMKDEINPNVLVYEPSPGKMTELFQSGQAAIAVWGTGRVQGLRQHRLPGRLHLSQGRRAVRSPRPARSPGSMNAKAANEFIKT